MTARRVAGRILTWAGLAIAVQGYAMAEIHPPQRVADALVLGLIDRPPAGAVDRLVWGEVILRRGAADCWQLRWEHRLGRPASLPSWQCHAIAVRLSDLLVAAIVCTLLGRRLVRPR